MTEKIRVTVFVGSARKKHTYQAAQSVLREWAAHSDIEAETVMLNEYNIQVCRGCKLCCDHGEELCPLKDDRDILLQKMDESDCILLAAPNYSFHVSAIMKIFLDRLAFLFHRPRFFGKTFGSLVTQGVYGGGAIVKYFNFIGKAMGCGVVKGVCLKTLEPMSEKQEDRNGRVLKQFTQGLEKQLHKKKYPTPSLADLLIFRISRNQIQKKLSPQYRDYTYYEEKGWFRSDFYYPVKLGPLKKLAGRIMDSRAS